MIGKLMGPLAVLADEELRRAREEYGDRYASDHEGYGILAEEVQEALDEIRSIQKEQGLLLRAIRYGDPLAPLLSAIRMEALQGAAELIQVAAVCAKMQEGGE